jgi:uncharacterized protein (DUF305 family)
MVRPHRRRPAVPCIAGSSGSLLPQRNSIVHTGQIDRSAEPGSQLVRASVMGRLVTAGLAILCMTLAGCGGNVDGVPQAGPDPDAFFVHRMIEHSRQATEAAKLAKERTTNPTVLRLAKAIQTDADAESPPLNALAGRMGPEPPGTRSSVPGAFEVKKLDGTGFGRKWTAAMIAHHRGAIIIARTELAQGRDPEARALAQRIVDTRQPRLGIMQGKAGG